MSVAKISEITSTSKKSFEDATEKGIQRASKTLKNITGAWVKDMKVDVEKGKITTYRVNLKVTFVLKDYATTRMYDSVVGELAKRVHREPGSAGVLNIPARGVFIPAYETWNGGGG